MKWRIILPAAYLAPAAGVWIDFVNTNPDGLANLGLMFVVLPITVAGLFIGWLVDQESFVLLPDGLGYFGDHALFYVPSVALIALALWLLGRRIDRIRG
ncbi:hypothetical protein GCM10010869_24380 [Mesorhizobium tianshanense]|uniref:Uncharacterized protein n=1 Tax=Mesorhizobium tianshanense TaxID=39844 RepID=A0A562N8D1_9HYPH|nr:hypothetical protein [Mesorhizobium tianshanense]TWI28373.1 hypothetical protein IQ26_05251 [Mesorhizobium tianshanense]GLS36847.1 hypothetical protein GCM10010869_24380 [Mesorhizobium tianshanense]